jgi:hypothetical protein
MCESIAPESKAEEFDSPKMKSSKINFQLAMPVPVDSILRPLICSAKNDIIYDKSERKRRYQKFSIRMKMGFLFSSLSRLALQLLGRYLPFPCEKTIHKWFHTREEQVAQ